MNPLRGETRLEAGAGPLSLVFDVEALVLAEEMLGETTDAIIVALEAETVDVRRVRAMLWAGLQRHHARPVEPVSALLQAVGYPAARAAVLAGLRNAFGTREDGDEAHPPLPGRWPGGWSFWRIMRRRGAARTVSGDKRRG